MMEPRQFDPARHLKTEEAILYYLEAAMVGNDPRHIASALGLELSVQKKAA
jgi:DNA-binding phage protein